MKEVVIIINKEGKATIEAKGYIGSECRNATRAFEEALGDVQERLNKPEYWKRDQNYEYGEQGS